MVPGSARNWIAVNAVKQSSLTKNENKKYDNSTPTKFNRPVAFAACFSSHPARPFWMRPDAGCFARE
jgi:hypothetical protein